MSINIKHEHKTRIFFCYLLRITQNLAQSVLCQRLKTSFLSDIIPRLHRVMLLNCPTDLL